MRTGSVRKLGYAAWCGWRTKRNEEAPRTLSARALNRALLARQMLLARETITVAKCVERHVGMQSQLPASPYVGLWSRVASFDPEALSSLIETRRVVRMALMRSTIHLVTAHDALALRPLVQPAMDRALLGSHRKALAGLDREDVAEAGRRYASSHPCTLHALGEHLAERWPERDGEALGNAVRTWVPLVQVPPRGLWGKGGLAIHTTAEQWLGHPLDPSPDLKATLLRYFGAFGPASIQDAQTWSGLTRLREAIEELEPQLTVFRDEEGNDLFDLPTAPRPEETVHAAVRFLPEYDNTLLAHSNRSRIVGKESWAHIAVKNGMRATVLIDGFARASWSVVRSRGVARLTIVPFDRLTMSERGDLTGEAARLLAFLASDAKKREITVSRG